MKAFAKLTIAGVAGFFLLKLLAGLILPVLGLAAGAVALAVKLAVVLLVGWFVLSLFGRRKREAA